MMTVREVSRRTGVTVRALQYYDQIGLLPPAKRTEAGYRLYDERALQRLGQIMLFRELEFSLDEIRAILDRPDFDRDLALADQIRLLTMRRDRLDALIDLANTLRQKGGTSMDFTAFDKTGIDQYAEQARARWGKTPEYAEYTQKAAQQTPGEAAQAGRELMDILAAFGAWLDRDPAELEVQAQVARLRAHISAHFYTCTAKTLSGLGRLYAAGGEFTQNIDAAGGPGTAAYADRAIQIYCQNQGV